MFVGLPKGKPPDLDLPEEQTPGGAAPAARRPDGLHRAARAASLRGSALMVVMGISRKLVNKKMERLGPPNYISIM